MLHSRCNPYFCVGTAATPFSVSNLASTSRWTTSFRLSNFYVVQALVPASGRSRLRYLDGCLSNSITTASLVVVPLVLWRVFFQLPPSPRYTRSISVFGLRGTISYKSRTFFASGETLCLCPEGLKPSTNAFRSSKESHLSLTATPTIMFSLHYGLNNVYKAHCETFSCALGQFLFYRRVRTVTRHCKSCQLHQLRCLLVQMLSSIE